MFCLLKAHARDIMPCLSKYVNPAYKATTLHDLHKILAVNLLIQVPEIKSWVRLRY